MRSGIIKWFDKGFGFIIDAEDGSEVFVHWSGIVYDGYKRLYEKDEVTYEIAENEKGIYATNVQLQKRVVDTRKYKKPVSREN